MGRARSLYIIVCNDEYFKLGYSQDPMRRCKDLQSGCPYELKLVYVSSRISEADSVLIEGRLHEVMRADGTWVRGEWFKVSPSTTATIIGEVIDYLIKNKVKI